MTELEMFNLIMFYFPHRSEDESLIIKGDCYGLPYAAFGGHIVIDFISKGGDDIKDIDSITRMINDIYNTDLVKGKICSTSIRDISCEELFSEIIQDGLEHLYPENKFKPLFKFKGKALEKVNYWLRQDERFNKVLFG
mgnify:CR=1 FL=1